MADTREIILSVVSHEPNRRLVLAVREHQEKPIVLRTESLSPDVGWYSQQELTLTRSELAGLKNVLGIKIPKVCESVMHLGDSGADGQPMVLSFAEAKSRRA